MWPGPSWNFYSGGGDPLQMTPEINVRKELANTSHYKEKDPLHMWYPKIPLSKTSPHFTAEKLSSIKQYITQDHTSDHLSAARPSPRSPTTSVTSAPSLCCFQKRSPQWDQQEEATLTRFLLHHSEPSEGLGSINTASGSTMQCYSALLTALGAKYSLSGFSETKASETQGAQRPFSKTKPKMATGPWRTSDCTSGRAHYLSGFSHPGQLSTG